MKYDNEGFCPECQIPILIKIKLSNRTGLVLCGASQVRRTRLIRLSSKETLKRILISHPRHSFDKRQIYLGRINLYPIWRIELGLSGEEKRNFTNKFQ